MAQAICSNHGTIEAVWKEGVGKKSGKNYAFWSCESKMPNGDFCKGKVTVANTPSGKFDQGLDKSAAQSDNNKREETITRIAIAKSFIESGKKYDLDTVKEMERWLSWIQGRAQTITPPEAVSPAVAPVPTVQSDEIALSDIPF